MTGTMSCRCTAEVHPELLPVRRCQALCIQSVPAVSVRSDALQLACRLALTSSLQKLLS
jgi:hypothetical protein